MKIRNFGYTVKTDCVDTVLVKQCL